MSKTIRTSATRACADDVMWNSCNERLSTDANSKQNSMLFNPIAMRRVRVRVVKKKKRNGTITGLQLIYFWKKEIWKRLSSAKRNRNSTRPIVSETSTTIQTYMILYIPRSTVVTYKYS